MPDSPHGPSALHPTQPAAVADANGTAERGARAVPTLAQLPATARRAVLELAAAVLGEMSADQAPPPLRRVRSFAPARRASAGAGPLGVALDGDPAFRQVVAAAWRAAHADVVEPLQTGLQAGRQAGLQTGVVPDDVPALRALEGIYLMRPPGWEQAWRRLREELADDQDVEARRRDVETGFALTAARSELAGTRAALARAELELAALAQEVATLRKDARRLRSEADRARAASRRVEEELAQATSRQAAAQAEHDQVLRTTVSRAAAAEQAVETVRRAGRDARALSEVRLRLLLDTLVEAANGLRRELALPPAHHRPADLVDTGSARSLPPTATPTAAPHARALPSDDPGPLQELLSMPLAHLVVDGYNVTKEGFGTVPLGEQRRRLTEGLAVLAARTGAEVTCCFDGAEVEARSAVLRRGVRVLFSDPGTTADELIRRLVRAEPPGRVVVVVSSDQEVAASVRATGARVASSSALLRMLGRG